jgi:hypothetical protein
MVSVGTLPVFYSNIGEVTGGKQLKNREMQGKAETMYRKMTIRREGKR